MVFDRKEAKNAIDRETVIAFEAALAGLTRENVQLLFLRGEHGTFVAGGDLRDLHSRPAEEVSYLMGRMEAALLSLGKLPYPTVAWVEGHAVGGGVEMALSADLVWTHPEAVFHLNQVTLGLLPGWGGLARLKKRLGDTRAKAVLLDGRPLGAEEALATGLVDRILPGLDRAREEADRLAGHPREAVRALKGLVEGTLKEDERKLFVRLWTDPAHTARVQSFLEGRKKP